MDAAYNMYRALHTDSFSVIQADSSGMIANQTTSAPGSRVTLNTTGWTSNISFRAACGSAAGMLNIIVRSGDTDVTNNVLCASGSHYGTVDIARLREYENVSITVAHTLVNGASGYVVYAVTDDTPPSTELTVCTSAIGTQVMYYQDKYYYISNGTVKGWGGQVCIVKVSDYVSREIKITAAHAVADGADYAVFTTNLPSGLSELSDPPDFVGFDSEQNQEDMIESFVVSTEWMATKTITATIPEGAKYLVFTNCSNYYAAPTVELLSE